MYIHPAAKALRHLDRWVDWQRGDRPAPVTLEWDLSNRCVLGCQNCHFAHTHSKGPWAIKTLPLVTESTGDLADRTLLSRTLWEAGRIGVKAIVWSGGGEPTTHPDWLAIVDEAAKQGLQQGMYTCGGLLTEQSGYQLGSKATWVVVSLDTVSADDYAREKGVPPMRFYAACDGVRFVAAARRATVGVSFLLHAQNWRLAPAMLELARSLGATYTTFRPAIRTSTKAPGICTDDRAWITTAAPIFSALAQEPDVEMAPARFEAYRDWQSHGYATCYGIRLNTTITPDGRVWTCPQHRGVSGSCLGDLRHESFTVIWKRHPGQRTVDAACRVMCRLHPVNQTLAQLQTPQPHEAFV